MEAKKTSNVNYARMFNNEVMIILFLLSLLNKQNVLKIRLLNGDKTLQNSGQS